MSSIQNTVLPTYYVFFKNQWHIKIPYEVQTGNLRETFIYAQFVSELKLLLVFLRGMYFSLYEKQDFIELIFFQWKNTELILQFRLFLVVESSEKCLELTYGKCFF